MKEVSARVQPGKRDRANKRKRPKTATSGFFTIPPRERSGMNRQILTQRCCGCVGNRVILAKGFGYPPQSWQDKNGPPAREKRPKHAAPARPRVTGPPFIRLKNLALLPPKGCVTHVTKGVVMLRKVIVLALANCCLVGSALAQTAPLVTGNAFWNALANPGMDPARSARLQKARIKRTR